MNNYSIYRVGTHGDYRCTGYFNITLKEAREGLRSILKNYKEDTPRGFKYKNFRIDRDTIAVYDGG